MCLNSKRHSVMQLTGMLRWVKHLGHNVQNDSRFALKGYWFPSLSCFKQWKSWWRSMTWCFGEISLLIMPTVIRMPSKYIGCHSHQFYRKGKQGHLTILSFLLPICCNITRTDKDKQQEEKKVKEEMGDHEVWWRDPSLYIHWTRTEIQGLRRYLPASKADSMTRERTSTTSWT